MLQVHNEGKAVVANGTREKCEIDVARLHAHGLWATMQRGRLSGSRVRTVRPRRDGTLVVHAATSGEVEVLELVIARARPMLAASPEPDGAVTRPAVPARLSRSHRGGRRARVAGARARRPRPRQLAAFDGDRGPAGAARRPATDGGDARSCSTAEQETQLADRRSTTPGSRSAPRSASPRTPSRRCSTTGARPRSLDAVRAAARELLERDSPTTARATPATARRIDRAAARSGGPVRVAYPGSDHAAADRAVTGRRPRSRAQSRSTLFRRGRERGARRAATPCGSRSSPCSSGGHLLVEGMPGHRQDAARQVARGRDRRPVRPGAVHARPPAGRRHRHVGVRPGHRRVGVPPRADLRQRRARRRGEPRVAAHAGRAARADGGAPGHGRRRDPPAARAVLPRRDRRTRSERGHVPAAREPARPLRARVHARPARPRRRARDPRRRGRRRRARRDRSRSRRPAELAATIAAVRARALRALGARLRARRRRRDAHPSRRRARRVAAREPRPAARGAGPRDGDGPRLRVARRREGGRVGRARAPHQLSSGVDVAAGARVVGEIVGAVATPRLERSGARDAELAAADDDADGIGAHGPGDLTLTSIVLFTLGAYGVAAGARRPARSASSRSACSRSRCSSSGSCGRSSSLARVESTRRRRPTRRWATIVPLRITVRRPRVARRGAGARPAGRWWRTACRPSGVIPHVATRRGVFDTSVCSSARRRRSACSSARATLRVALPVADHGRAPSARRRRHDRTRYRRASSAPSDRSVARRRRRHRPRGAARTSPATRRGSSTGRRAPGAASSSSASTSRRQRWARARRRSDGGSDRRRREMPRAAPRGSGGAVLARRWPAGAARTNATGRVGAGSPTPRRSGAGSRARSAGRPRTHPTAGRCSCVTRHRRPAGTDVTAPDARRIADREPLMSDRSDPGDDDGERRPSAPGSPWRPVAAVSARRTRRDRCRGRTAARVPGRARRAGGRARGRARRARAAVVPDPPRRGRAARPRRARRAPARVAADDRQRAPRVLGARHARRARARRPGRRRAHLAARRRPPARAARSRSAAGRRDRSRRSSPSRRSRSCRRVTDRLGRHVWPGRRSRRSATRSASPSSLRATRRARHDEPAPALGHGRVHRRRAPRRLLARRDVRHLGRAESGRGPTTRRQRLAAYRRHVPSCSSIRTTPARSHGTAIAPDVPHRDRVLRASCSRRRARVAVETDKLAHRPPRRHRDGRRRLRQGRGVHGHEPQQPRRPTDDLRAADSGAGARAIVRDRYAAAARRRRHGCARSRGRSPRARRRPTTRSARSRRGSARNTKYSLDAPLSPHGRRRRRRLPVPTRGSAGASRSRAAWSCSPAASASRPGSRPGSCPARRDAPHGPLRRARARRARVGRDLLPRGRLAGVRPDRVGAARGRREPRRLVAGDRARRTRCTFGDRASVLVFWLVVSAPPARGVRRRRRRRRPGRPVAERSSALGRRARTRSGTGGDGRAYARRRRDASASTAGRRSATSSTATTSRRRAPSATTLDADGLLADAGARPSREPRPSESRRRRCYPRSDREGDPVRSLRRRSMPRASTSSTTRADSRRP